VDIIKGGEADQASGGHHIRCAFAAGFAFGPVSSEAAGIMDVFQCVPTRSVDIIKSGEAVRRGWRNSNSVTISIPKGRQICLPNSPRS
jgi:hypothetical protein